MRNLYLLLTVLILCIGCFTEPVWANPTGARPYRSPNGMPAMPLAVPPTRPENITTPPLNLGGKPVEQVSPSTPTDTGNNTSTNTTCTNTSKVSPQTIANAVVGRSVPDVSAGWKPIARQSIPTVIEECAKIGVTDNARLAVLISQIMLESGGQPDVLNYECTEPHCSDGTPRCAEGLIQVIDPDCVQKRRIAKDLGVPFKPRLFSDMRFGARVACEFAKKNRWFDGQYSFDEIGFKGEKAGNFLKARQAIYGVSTAPHVLESAEDLRKTYPVVFKAIKEARQNSSTPNCTPDTSKAPPNDPNIIRTPPTSSEDADQWCKPHEKGWIVSYFKEWRTYRYHWGLDISNHVEPVHIYAAKSGTVYLGEDECGDPYVEIKHPKNKDNITKTRYLHLKRGTVKVKTGDKVKCGQEIAMEGGHTSVGCSSGGHLHYQAYCGDLIDPECLPTSNKSVYPYWQNSSMSQPRSPLCAEARKMCKADFAMAKPKPTTPPPPKPKQPLSSYGHCYFGDVVPSSSQLVAVGNGESMIAVAAKAYKDMERAARQDGVTLVPLSGFRSLDTQSGIFNRGGVPPAERSKSVAPPGYSEHHTGYAIDIGDANAPNTHIQSSFANTGASQWLSRNARRFGFELSFDRGNCQGVTYEPWHWRYVGDGKLPALVSRCFNSGVGSCKA